MPTSQVLQLPAIPQMTSETVDWDRVRFELADLIKVEEPKEGGVALGFDTVVNDTPQEIQAKVDKARAYAKRLGATMASSAQGHAFFNGKHYDLDDVSVQLFPTCPQCFNHSPGKDVRTIAPNAISEILAISARTCTSPLSNMIDINLQLRVFSSMKAHLTK